MSISYSIEFAKLIIRYHKEYLFHSGFSRTETGQRVRGLPFFPLPVIQCLLTAEQTFMSLSILNLFVVEFHPVNSRSRFVFCAKRPFDNQVPEPPESQNSGILFVCQAI